MKGVQQSDFIIISIVIGNKLIAIMVNTQLINISLYNCCY